MKMVFVSLILLLSLGWQNQRSVLFLKTETIKKADVARGVTFITKQRSQTIEEEVKNLCTKYCCRSLNKQSSAVQERINPFYINSYGENSFGLRTTFRNELSSWTEVWLYSIIDWPFWWKHNVFFVRYEINLFLSAYLSVYVVSCM